MRAVEARCRVPTYIHIHIHTHIHTYTHINTTHIHVHTIYIYTYLCALAKRVIECLHAYTYTYIHIYTHTHTYIHTHTSTHHAYTYTQYIHTYLCALAKCVVECPAALQRLYARGRCRRVGAVPGVVRHSLDVVAALGHLGGRHGVGAAHVGLRGERDYGCIYLISINRVNPRYL